MFLIHALPGMASDALGEMADRLLGQLWNLVALHLRLTETLDPDNAGTIRADLDDLIVVEPGTERPKRAIKEDREISGWCAHA
jgi:RecA/RadA recombinase